MTQRRFVALSRPQNVFAHVLSLVVICAAVLVGPTQAQAATQQTPQSSLESFAAVGLTASSIELSRTFHSQDQVSDADGDAIPDDIELAICGSKTCATGLEDADNDGIADWVEFLSCGTRTCASATKDRDGDGIPDYAERLVCGTDTCSNSLEDADGDRISDWVEFVVCGTRTCATGFEDYDGDGVSDAAQLAACVKRVDPSLLALTGQPWFWLMLLLGFAGLGTGGWLLWRRRIVEHMTGAARSVEMPVS
ncbi:hypothetical protein QBL02_13415 [Leucobacter sp. UT-8R-CII-1-4]|uniref:hypothetical protein n=1 Tax=Leucobacter sp. UT-8R-CII-1-4 TaxID=3040075 RepID=UPI0024A973DC|nr:hypothetical protein [Leucobacter sp. UT-8R-CII-1-4]MDI6024537.1 hypothetical protein [Leucobacter sp. UT-8R-CII-1-4]